MVRKITSKPITSHPCVGPLSSPHLSRLLVSTRRRLGSLIAHQCGLTPLPREGSLTIVGPLRRFCFDEEFVLRPCHSTRRTNNIIAAHKKNTAPKKYCMFLSSCPAHFRRDGSRTQHALHEATTCFPIVQVGSMIRETIMHSAKFQCTFLMLRSVGLS